MTRDVREDLPLVRREIRIIRAVGAAPRWLEPAAPDLMAGLVKSGKAALDKDALGANLAASGAAMRRLIERGFETGQVKGFRPHPTAFVGYLMSHGGYHLGEVGIILAQAGHPLDRKVSYGMWEWGLR